MSSKSATKNEKAFHKFIIQLQKRNIWKNPEWEIRKFKTSSTSDNIERNNVKLHETAEIETLINEYEISSFVEAWH